MTESELDQRKKDFESEKETFYNKLHELERERAMTRAQESSNKEKLEALKLEKEKYEHLYLELKDQQQAKLEQVETQSRARIKELESQLEEKKTEFYQTSSQYEKNLALIQQELNFLKKENENLKDKCEKTEAARNKLNDELKVKDLKIEVSSIRYYLKKLGSERKEF